MTEEKEFGLVWSSLHCFFAGKHLMIMLYSPRFTAHYFRIARKKAPVITITACLGAFSLSEITWCKYLGLKCYSCRSKVYFLVHLGKRVVLYCHCIAGFPAILSEEGKEAKRRGWRQFRDVCLVLNWGNALVRIDSILKILMYLIRLCIHSFSGDRSLGEKATFKLYCRRNSAVAGTQMRLRASLDTLMTIMSVKFRVFLSPWTRSIASVCVALPTEFN